MESDVSKKTVVVLLILAIIISVVGTLVVLEEAGRARSVTGQEQALQGADEPNQVGIISVNIQPRPAAEFQGGAE